MSGKVQIVVNGLTEQIDSDVSISMFLKSKAFEATKVVVEINKKIIKRDSFDAYLLTNGDCVEILRFVGGG
jgi:sulfur carrier protein